MSRRSWPWPHLLIAFAVWSVLLVGVAFILDQFRGSF